MFTSYTGTDMPNLDSILENYGVKRSSGIICGDRFPALLSADAVLSAAEHSE